MGFPGNSDGKESLPAVQEMRGPSLGREDPLEEGIATHSSIVAWRISWTEDSGGLQSMGLQSWIRLSKLHFNNHNTHRSRRKTNTFYFALFRDFMQASSILINFRS